MDTWKQARQHLTDVLKDKLEEYTFDQLLIPNVTLSLQDIRLSLSLLSKSATINAFSTALDEMSRMDTHLCRDNALIVIRAFDAEKWLLQNPLVPFEPGNVYVLAESNASKEAQMTEEEEGEEDFDTLFAMIE
jgi:hypothetical protein